MVKLQLVQHNFKGNLPIFELQVFSIQSNKWYALKTGSRLTDIETFCKMYSLPVPKEIIQCNNHK